MAMTTPKKSLGEAFPELLRAATRKHLGNINGRALAHMAKVPVAEVQSWLDGKKLPDSHTFGRLVFILPSLRHLKPQLVEATRERDHEKERLRLERAATLPRHFGQALAVSRTADELSQQDVADLLGVTSQAVSAWETAANVPILEHYERLITLWPELDTVRPSVQDIEKPSVGAGVPRDAIQREPSGPWRSSSLRQPLPLSTHDLAARDGSLLPLTPLPPPTAPPAAAAAPPMPPPSPPPFSIPPTLTPPQPQPPSPPVQETPPPMAPSSPAVVTPIQPSSPTPSVGPVAVALMDWLEILPSFARAMLSAEEVLAMLDLAEKDGVSAAQLASMIRRTRR